MADVATAKAAAAAQGASAPANYPGGPDKWAQDWYDNALKAGSIRGGAAQTASATQSQSTGGGPLLPPGASGYNAQDPTAYRNIDPKVLQGMTPEQRAEWSMQNIDDLSAHGDAARSKAQWMTWQKSYDPNCPPSDPYQAEDGSGCVEKPDNSNKGYQAGAAGGGGGKGGQQVGGGAAPTKSIDPLQQGLVNLYQERGGMFAGQKAGGFGQDLASGGIFTGDGGQNPAVAAAALNAFTPAAPSQQPQNTAPQVTSMQQGLSGGQQLQQSLGATSAFGGGITGRGGAPTAASIQPIGGAPPPAMQQQPLQAALANKFSDPNKWWAGQSKVY